MKHHRCCVILVTRCFYSIYSFLLLCFWNLELQFDTVYELCFFMCTSTCFGTMNYCIIIDGNDLFGVFFGGLFFGTAFDIVLMSCCCCAGSFMVQVFGPHFALDFIVWFEKVQLVI